MMRSRAGRVLVTMAIAVSVASSCTRSVPRSPQPEPAGRLDVRPCPGIPGFSCGSLRVRLDPAGAVTGELSLRVAVSDVSAAPRGVLLFLTGGPGEPGLPFASPIAGRLGSALRGYRMVMFDQRGTGAGALDCPALQRQLGASDLTVPAAVAVRSCAAAIGPDRVVRSRTGRPGIPRRPRSPGAWQRELSGAGLAALTQLGGLRCGARSRGPGSRRSTAPGPGGTPARRERRA